MSVSEIKGKQKKRGKKRCYGLHVCVCVCVCVCLTLSIATLDFSFFVSAGVKLELKQYDAAEKILRENIVVCFHLF